MAHAIIMRSFSLSLLKTPPMTCNDSGWCAIDNETGYPHTRSSGEHQWKPVTGWRRSCLAAHAWARLIGLQHRVCLAVADNDRPEASCRDIRRHGQFAGLATVAAVAFRVLDNPGVSQSPAIHLHLHRRRHARGEVVEEGRPVEVCDLSMCGWYGPFLSRVNQIQNFDACPPIKIITLVAKSGFVCFNQNYFYRNRLHPQYQRYLAQMRISCILPWGWVWAQLSMRFPANG